MIKILLNILILNFLASLTSGVILVTLGVDLTNPYVKVASGIINGVIIYFFYAKDAFDQHFSKKDT